MTAKNKAVWRDTYPANAAPSEFHVRPSIVSRSWYRRNHRSNERCQLGSHAALLVLIGKLKNRGPLGFSQISPTWIGVRYTRFLNATVALSRTRMLGGS